MFRAFGLSSVISHAIAYRRSNEERSGGASSGRASPARRDVVAEERPVKILFAGPYPPVRDGIGEFTWMLGQEMRRGGHEVRVVVPYPVAGLPAEVVGSLRTARRERARLRRALAAWKPDVVHVQFAIAGFGIRTVALIRWLDRMRRDAGVPVVVTLHEPTRESAALPLLGRAAQRAIASRCDHFIVHTPAARSAVVAGLGIPAGRVSLTALPDARFRGGSGTDAHLRTRFGLAGARVLLSFGFIHVDKGLDDLVDALGLLRDSAPAVLDGVRVVLAGDVRPRHGAFRLMGARDRRYLTGLIRRIGRSGLQDVIVTTGYVPDEDVAGWFGLADAVVLPYREAEQSGVERLARSAGVPVLASSAIGPAEPSALTRWIFPPRAPARLAETVRDFLTTADRETPRPEPASSDLAPVAAATLDLYRLVAGQEPARAQDVS
jgi:glycosyltransferase involved in cell wall biosynthesis